MIELALAALLLTPASSPDAQARDAQDCPAIFGTEHAVSENAAWRKQHLHAFAITDKRVEITHSVARWKSPKPLRMTGLELVEVRAEEGERPVAVVSLGDSLQSVCEPGLYEVSADDALGQSGQVLVVDERGVLVEQGGKLAFLPWAGHPVPKQLRMVWRSPYNVVMESSGSSGSSGGKSAAKKPAKKERKRSKRPERKKRK